MAGLPHSEIRGSTGARPSPRLIAACYVLHRLSVPRHSPNALRRLIRSPNRNAEANRPRPSRNDERHTQHFFSAGPGDNARELPPAKDPAKGRPHKPIHNVKEQMSGIRHQGSREDPMPAPKHVLFRNPPSPGGAERDRTDDLLLAKQALSQLSYSPSQRPEDRYQVSEVFLNP